MGQTIISISREYGSGGHEIAGRVAEAFGLPMYDKQILREIAEKQNISLDLLKRYEERPRNLLMSRRVAGHSNSMEDIVTEFQFQYMLEKAEAGESFVIVGRCSDSVLQPVEGLISVFVTGAPEYRVRRIMEYENLDNEAAARKRMEAVDHKRRQYHNRYADHKWGDPHWYDICIDGGRLGAQGTADVLEVYIRACMKQNQ